MAKVNTTSNIVGTVAGISQAAGYNATQGHPGYVNLSPNSFKSVVTYRYPIGYIPNYNLPNYNLKGRSLNIYSTH